MVIMNTNRTGFFWVAIGAIFAGLSVALGAFGAHGLESSLQEFSEDPEKSLQQWETASRYQMYHSIGIILIGVCFAIFGKRFGFQFAGIAFVVGIILFSGSLYGLVLSQVKILGAIVPLGGLAMILGWSAFAMAAIRIPMSEEKGTHASD